MPAYILLYLNWYYIGVNMENVSNQKESGPSLKHKTIPEMLGIRVTEAPSYQIIKKDGEFEVRHYPKQLIAKITLHGMSYDYFRENAFKKLAAYIFEGHKNEEQVPMTSPVLQHEDPSGAWSMSFIMPPQYTLQTAPKPKNPEIVLEEVEPYDAAAVSYAGNNKLDKIQLHKKELANWIETQPGLQTEGHYFIAQYDAPFVLPIMKKNEILIKVNILH